MKKILTLCLLLAPLFMLAACSTPMAYRIDTNAPGAKLTVFNGESTSVYTLQGGGIDLTDKEFNKDSTLTIDAQGYQSFSGKMANLERAGENAFRVMLTEMPKK